MKKFLCLLAFLIVAPIMLCGCAKSESAFQASCTVLTNIDYVKVQEQYQGGWITYNNVEKVELRNDSGVAYVYLERSVITTTLNNLVIKHKR